uniref:Uncharacterized protein n=1 Tax=Setaria viridis TaxID=4556 RepID=A0A4U6UVL6_SETVI|nr:hypothetical protein SEVIR_4G104301v2 [Setaria viridis]
MWRRGVVLDPSLALGGWDTVTRLAGTPSCSPAAGVRCGSRAAATAFRRVPRLGSCTCHRSPVSTPAAVNEAGRPAGPCCCLPDLPARRTHVSLQF